LLLHAVLLAQRILHRTAFSLHFGSVRLHFGLHYTHTRALTGCRRVAGSRTRHAAPLLPFALQFAVYVLRSAILHSPNFATRFARYTLSFFGWLRTILYLFGLVRYAFTVLSVAGSCLSSRMRTTRTLHHICACCVLLARFTAHRLRRLHAVRFRGSWFRQFRCWFIFALHFAIFILVCSRLGYRVFSSCCIRTVACLLPAMVWFAARSHAFTARFWFGFCTPPVYYFTFRSLLRVWFRFTGCAAFAQFCAGLYFRLTTARLHFACAAVPAAAFFYCCAVHAFRFVARVLLRVRYTLAHASWFVLGTPAPFAVLCCRLPRSAFPRLRLPFGSVTCAITHRILCCGLRALHTLHWFGSLHDTFTRGCGCGSFTFVRICARGSAFFRSRFPHCRFTFRCVCGCGCTPAHNATAAFVPALGLPFTAVAHTAHTQFSVRFALPFTFRTPFAVARYRRFVHAPHTPRSSTARALCAAYRSFHTPHRVYTTTSGCTIRFAPLGSAFLLVHVRWFWVLCLSAPHGSPTRSRSYRFGCLSHRATFYFSRFGLFHQFCGLYWFVHHHWFALVRSTGLPVRFTTVCLRRFVPPHMVRGCVCLRFFLVRRTIRCVIRLVHGSFGSTHAAFVKFCAPLVQLVRAMGCAFYALVFRRIRVLVLACCALLVYALFAHCIRAACRFSPCCCLFHGCRDFSLVRYTVPYQIRAPPVCGSPPARCGSWFVFHSRTAVCAIRAFHFSRLWFWFGWFAFVYGSHYATVCTGLRRTPSSVHAVYTTRFRHGCLRSPTLSYAYRVCLCATHTLFTTGYNHSHISTAPAPVAPFRTAAHARGSRTHGYWLYTLRCCAIVPLCGYVLFLVCGWPHVPRFTCYAVLVTGCWFAFRLLLRSPFCARTRTSSPAFILVLVTVYVPFTAHVTIYALHVPLPRLWVYAYTLRLFFLHIDSVCRFTYLCLVRSVRRFAHTPINFAGSCALPFAHVLSPHFARLPFSSFSPVRTWLPARLRFCWFTVVHATTRTPFGSRSAGSRLVRVFHMHTRLRTLVGLLPPHHAFLRFGSSAFLYFAFISPTWFFLAFAGSRSSRYSLRTAVHTLRFALYFPTRFILVRCRRGWVLLRRLRQVRFHCVVYGSLLLRHFARPRTGLPRFTHLPPVCSHAHFRSCLVAPFFCAFTGSRVLYGWMVCCLRCHWVHLRRLVHRTFSHCWFTVRGLRFTAVCTRSAPPPPRRLYAVGALLFFTGSLYCFAFGWLFCARYARFFAAFSFQFLPLRRRALRFRSGSLCRVHTALRLFRSPPARRLRAASSPAVLRFALHAVHFYYGFG